MIAMANFGKLEVMQEDAPGREILPFLGLKQELELSQFQQRLDFLK
jgi:hypothetical protein